ncbi:MAG: bifunctional transaldolase/phosoglucose isomerase, partial [Anaerolineales bacterium]
MTKLNDLAKLGQAIWLDYIQRGYMQSGELQKLVDMGVRGMTSNPTIFEKAIAGSRDYDADVASLAPRGKSTQEIYEALVADDIRMAADMLLPVYQATETEDGYVSLEVSPELAHDTQGTIDEASRLWSQVDRPNLMIKIPATQEGLPAITRSIASGINVNVTLIFSLERYQDVMEAYLQGLEERLRAGKPLEKIASVASFFVSRLDTKVDERLLRIMKDEEPGASRAAQLLGRAAVNNARLAYQLFDEIFHRPRFDDLASQGARVQRPLWASTSTKNPAYSDILYVQELIGAHTVNTLPQNTLEAFLDHGQVTTTIGNELQRAHQEISALDQIGISMQEVTQELEDEGVTAFAKSYQELLTSIETKRADLLSGRRAVRSSLGVYHGEVDESLNRLAAQDILSRIWKQDYTVWKPDPNEITNRLGWLYIANEMENRARQMEAVAFGVRSAGYRHIVLLGMGGSSLAPELFARTFGSTEGYPELSVLDTTDPGAVLELESGIDYAKTAFIVSSKSGGTVETLSLFKYFYQKSVDAFGSAAAGEHFIAITDPGSHLVDIAGSLKFRSVFLNDPDIGGRYSALSYFGLLPAALIGLDLYRLLGSARKMADACRPGRVLDANPAAWLGTILGSLAGMNRDMRRDKLTLVLSPAIASFGDWVEQLIAESTGKAGKGILPVVGEELAAPEAYGDDRL